MKLFWMEVKRQTTSLTFTIYTLLVMAFVLLNMWPMLARNVAALPTSTIATTISQQPTSRRAKQTALASYDTTISTILTSRIPWGLQKQ